jgi:hypothetical protein
MLFSVEKGVTNGGTIVHCNKQGKEQWKKGRNSCSPQGGRQKEEIERGDREGRQKTERGVVVGQFGSKATEMPF